MLATTNCSVIEGTGPQEKLENGRLEDGQNQLCKKSTWKITVKKNARSLHFPTLSVLLMPLR